MIKLTPREITDFMDRNYPKHRHDISDVSYADDKSSLGVLIEMKIAK